MRQQFFSACLVMALTTPAFSQYGGGLPQPPDSDVVVSPNDRQVNELYKRLVAQMPSTAALQDPNAAPTVHIHTNHTAAEKAITAKLNQPITFSYEGIGLSEVMQYIAESQQIPIVIEEDALNDEGIPLSEPIHFALAQIPIKSGLKIMLSPLGLTYVVEDNSLKITTITAADEKSMICFYDTRELGYILFTDFDVIINAIQSQTGDDYSWDAGGGVGSITAFPGGLLIKNTQKVHEQIADFFKLLEQQYAKPATSDEQNQYAPPKPQPDFAPPKPQN